jgi:fructosamine-3-kinase
MLSQSFILFLQKKLSQLLNENIIIHSTQSVYGGDINETFQLETSAQIYFLKTNVHAAKDMFEKEFNGLNLLLQSAKLHVPKPLLYGHFEYTSFLLMEFIEKGSATKFFWKDFAEGLAQLHQTTNDYFGLNEDNYIGSLHQSNTPCKTWSEFYATQHIIPLIKKAYEQKSCYRTDVEAAEKLCNKLSYIFPEEKPALLHGDLWNGNFMCTANGMASIYDPAVYYGNREMDIAMSLLFGGFDKSFYEHYNFYYPLENGWQQRVELCQLYPLLVHLVLFGGHYYFSVKKIIEQYE